MSASDIDFRGRSFMANDGIVQVWLRLLVQEIDQIHDPPAWLSEAREDWDFQAGGFMDYVELGLDRHLNSASRTAEIVHLSRRALKSQKKRDEYITADELNAMSTNGDGSFFTGPLPLVEFIRTGDYFMKLLTGELSPLEVDARFEPHAN